MGKLRTFCRAGLAGTAALLFLPGLAGQAWSQSTQTLQVPQAEGPLTATDLGVLVGPIALYADDLVGIVLPASTYPLQIVQARRFIDQLVTDPSLQPDPEWDSSIVALLNYPEVLRMMDTNIEWTWTLGEAVLNEQGAVLDAIQVFRRQALNAGNLASNDQQTVTQESNLIEIAPAEPEVIYVPYYEPERVVVAQPQPVIHYYADPYPVYYYPYPVGYRFRGGFFWGVTTAFNIGWHSHSLHVYHHLNALHPYYGFTYYTPWYARRGVNININVNRVNPVWTSQYRRVSRPTRSVSGRQVTVSREGRTNTGVRTTTTTRSGPAGTSATTTRSQTIRQPSTATIRSRTTQQLSTGTTRSQVTRQPSAVTTRTQTTRQRTTTTPTFASPQTNTRTTNRSATTSSQSVPTFASPNRTRTTTSSRAPTVQPRQSVSQPRTTSRSTVRSTQPSTSRSTMSGSRSTRSSSSFSSRNSSGSSGSSRSTNRSTRQNGRTR